MDGKQYFKDCCAQRGIDCEKYFTIGKGQKSGKRYEYRCPPYVRKPSQIFAIKYFGEEDLYIVWNLREEKAATKSVFSLKKKTRVMELSLDSITQVTKSLEYSGWGEEIVLAFHPECVGAFLKQYIPKQ